MYRTMNQRFKEAFEKLKEAEVFKTQREFVQPLEWNQSTLSDVLKNKRPLPIEIAITFCDKYNVNHEWLLHGKGKMLKEGTMPPAPKPTDIPHNLSSPEQQIANLRELLAEKQKVIDAQERIIKWQEHYFNKPRKALAHAIKPRPQ